MPLLTAHYSLLNTYHLLLTTHYLLLTTYYLLLTTYFLLLTTYYLLLSASDSVPLLHANHAPPHSTWVLVDMVLKRSASALFNGISTSYQIRMLSAIRESCDAPLPQHVAPSSQGDVHGSTSCVEVSRSLSRGE